MRISRLLSKLNGIRLRLIMGVLIPALDGRRPGEELRGYSSRKRNEERT